MATTTPNYDINYKDERFTQVEADKKNALNELSSTYDGMIAQSDGFYQAQIDAAKDWADTQTKLQNEKTDFAIEEIEQQKEQTKKDYTKEQSGAYVDWQKQSGQYGANAEAQAAQGLAGSGYSESSQVSLYNTYQNRVATARESYQRAILNYNNAITEARLQNNAILAEIAYEALRTQLELSLEGFQYKNSLLMAKTEAKTELENTYYERYQDVLDQINHENALAEEVRQYNASLAEEQRQFGITSALQERSVAVSERAQTLAEQKYADEKAATALITKTDESTSRGKKSRSSGTSKTSTSKKKATLTTKQSASSTKTTQSKYKAAAKKLRDAGATTGDGGLMTESEWRRRKISGSKRAEASYDTYDDYINSFTAWRIANPEK